MSFGGVRFNSGKSFIVGYGTPVPVPIALVPAEWEGALVYADDGDMYFSDGDDWVIISDAPIRRPIALTPTLPEHFRQLRLSAFLTGAGFTFTQTGIIFRASLNPDMTSPLLLNETVVTTTGNSYTLPDGFVEAGTTFYWQGKYTATDSQESQFSKIVSQVFPAQITAPVPLTPTDVASLTLSVGPYGSAFGYEYGSTNWEIYTTPAGGGTPLLAQTNALTKLELGPFQSTVLPGATYYWRARFNDITTLSSAWSALRPFTMDTSFSILDTADAPYFVGRTIRNFNNTPYQVPATVLDSNDIPFVCP